MVKETGRFRETRLRIITVVFITVFLFGVISNAVATPKLIESRGESSSRDSQSSSLPIQPVQTATMDYALRQKLDSMGSQQPQGNESVGILVKYDSYPVLPDGVEVTYVYNMLPLIAAKATLDQIDQITATAGVTSVYLDHEVEVLSVQMKLGDFQTLGIPQPGETYPYLGEYPAFLNDTTRQIGAQDVWDAGYDGSGVIIAMVDTGINKTHPNLDDLDDDPTTDDPKVIKEIDITAIFTEEPPDPMDDIGHGTHVAGIAAGTGEAGSIGYYDSFFGGFQEAAIMPGTQVGVAPGAWLYNVKVLRYGWGYDSWIIAGIEWSVAHGADIISMSLGGETFYASPEEDPMVQAVEAAVQAGVTVVIAAGNSGPSYYSVATPGFAPSAITVGAVYETDEIVFFSSRGPTPYQERTKPDLVAPGAAVVSSGDFMYTPDIEVYWLAWGTSMSTPHVAGAAALLINAFPGATPFAVKAALMKGADDLGLDDNIQGAGRLNVASALEVMQPPTPSVWNEIAPPENTIQPTLEITVFSDDMESGVNGWAADGLWHLTTRRFYSPVHSWWYGNESTGNYDTGATNWGSLVSPPISLPSADMITLVFNSWYETEDMGTFWDKKLVYISTDGGTTWTLIHQVSGSPMREWVEQAVDITSYAEKTVMIKFFFDTVDPVLNFFEGWYIDDVRVVATLLEPVPGLLPGVHEVAVGMTWPAYAYNDTSVQVGVNVTNFGDFSEDVTLTFVVYNEASDLIVSDTITILNLASATSTLETFSFIAQSVMVAETFQIGVSASITPLEMSYENNVVSGELEVLSKTVRRGPNPLLSLLFPGSLSSMSAPHLVLYPGDFNVLNVTALTSANLIDVKLRVTGNATEVVSFSNATKLAQHFVLPIWYWVDDFIILNITDPVPEFYIYGAEFDIGNEVSLGNVTGQAYAPIQVIIPDDAGTGTYTGTIDLVNGTTTIASVPVNIEVRKPKAKLVYDDVFQDMSAQRLWGGSFWYFGVSEWWRAVANAGYDVDSLMQVMNNAGIENPWAIFMSGQYSTIYLHETEYHYGLRRMFPALLEQGVSIVAIYSPWFINQITEYVYPEMWYGYYVFGTINYFNPEHLISGGLTGVPYPVGLTFTIGSLEQVAAAASDVADPKFSGVAVATFETEAQGKFVAVGSSYLFDLDLSAPDYPWIFYFLNFDIDVSALAQEANLAVNILNYATAREAPTISLTSPAEGSVLAGNVTIEFTVSGVSIEIVTLEIDRIGHDVTGQTSYTWDTTTVNDGDYTLNLTVTDAAGNTVSRVYSFKVDNTKPRVSIDNPSDGAELTKTVAIEFTPSDANLATVLLYIDNAKFNVTGETSYEWDTTAVGDGAHTIKLVAYDKAGNTATTHITVTTINVQKATEESYTTGKEEGYMSGRNFGLAIGALIGLVITSIIAYAITKRPLGRSPRTRS